MASHSHHHSSSSSSKGASNESYAHTFWYIISAVLGLACIIRIINAVECRIRLKKRHNEHPVPTRPTGFFRLWATATAITRELSHPQLFVSIPGLRWCTPPPLGRVIVLLVYWAVIIYITAYGVVVRDVRYYERIGFRNAWVAIAQVPLVYMLAMKFNPISLCTGIGYERLNWLHRWVARTLFVSSTIHGFHFWTQWARAEFITTTLRVMPMVRWGLAAWAILLWTFVTSFKPLRSVAYEIFVIQHVLSTVILLWVLYKHVPPAAMYHVWWSIAVVCFDRAARWSLLAWQNLRLRPDRSCCKGMRRFGHNVQARTVGLSTVILTVKDVHFSWSAGQHLYLWVPSLCLLETHPYTIACACPLPEVCVCNSIQLVVRRHKGFSNRLFVAAQKAQDSGHNLQLTAWVSGPYGMLPQWDAFEVLVLVSASTGASFTLPILEHVLQQGRRSCTRRVDFILSTKRGEEINWYVARLRDAARRSRQVGIVVNVHIAVTGQDARDASVAMLQGGSLPGSVASDTGFFSAAAKKAHTYALQSDVDAEADQPEEKTSEVDDYQCRIEDSFHQYSCRMDVAALVRQPVESATGETSVVVCSGLQLASQVRNCVARLSDERAVHKGTGAQGIHLYVEEYGF